MFCAFDVNVEESLPAYLRVCVHGGAFVFDVCGCAIICNFLYTCY